MSNSIVIKGNLTADPELRFTPGGDPVLSFSLADNQGYGDKQTTTFWRATLRGKRAQSLEPHLSKGSAVCVIGEASNRPYTDKQGNEQKSLEVRANDVWLIGQKQGRAESQAPSGKSQSRSSGGRPDEDIDVPF